MNLILKAAKFADAHHRGVFRKWGVRDPYIYHCMRVAGRASLIPGVPEHVVAADWLHDTVEDPKADGTRITILHIINEFGTDVGRIVSEMTNVSKAQKGLTREARKAADRERLRSISYWGKITKFIDRIDNVRELSTAPPSFQRVYVPESFALIHAIAMREDRIAENLAAELRDLLIPLAESLELDWEYLEVA